MDFIRKTAGGQTFSAQDKRGALAVSQLVFTYNLVV
jgi:hypothetical protein